MTEPETARPQDSEVRQVLNGLLRSLEGHQRQRRNSALRGGRATPAAVRAEGEVIGLQTAIDAIKRRLRA